MTSTHEPHADGTTEPTPNRTHSRATRAGDPEAGFDAFAAKDRLGGVGVFTDPYPRLAELRDRSPVHGGSVSAKFDAPGADRLLAAEDRQCAVYSFAGVDQVLRDPGTTFSSKWYGPSLGDVIGRTILEMDAPDHRRFRSLISKAFTKREARTWEDGFVRRIVDEHIDRFVDRQQADLAADFAFLYPINVVATAAGLPVDDIAAFYQHTAILTNIAVSRDDRLRASRDLGAMVRTLIDERRAPDADPDRADLVAVLVRARLDEQDWDGVTARHLTDDEIVAFMRLLVPAGAQTTYRALTTILYGLLSHPDQLDAVRADPALLPRAIEEGLRWEVPLLAVGRTAVRDAEVDGCPIAAGLHVNVPIGAANRDPARWERPDEFDIFRPQLGHLSFGAGPHVCLGIHSARMELRVALERLLERLPGLRLDPDTPCAGITGLGMRTAVRLPVVWDRPTG
jgi:cytochrome P450